MTQFFLDPSDPTVAFVADATDELLGMQIGDATLVNIHLAERCAGRACVVHAPSEHHMRSWPLSWRADRHLVERRCPHGIGHPDPDDAAYNRTTGRAWMVSHGCDGCCRPPADSPAP